MTQAPAAPMRSALDLALQIMARAHAGQVDKAGQPYVLHPIRVMMRLDTLDERVVALLHDVVEDSAVTLEELSAQGFSPAVVAAVGRLTKLEGESYEDFITRVMTDPLASRVKVADLSENIDITRLREVGDKDLARIAKYHRALSRLTSRGTSEPAVSTP